VSRRVGLRSMQSVGKGVRPLIGDLLDESWDSIVGWTKDGAGTLEIRPAGQLRSVPASGYYLGALKTISLPDQVTVEFRAKADSFGANGAIVPITRIAETEGEFPTFYGPYIRPTKVQIINEAGGKDEIPCVTDNDWHIWRLLIDNVAPSIKIYKDDNYIGEFTNIYREYCWPPAVPCSYLEFGAENTTGSGAEVHYDWSKADSGLKPP